MSKWIHCSTVQPGGYHCSSCHEDWDEYGYNMLEWPMPYGYTLSVCCSVADELEDAGFDWGEA